MQNTEHHLEDCTEVIDNMIRMSAHNFKAEDRTEEGKNSKHCFGILIIT